MKLLDKFLIWLSNLVDSKDKHYTPSLSTSDPLYKAKKDTIQSMNQNSALINKNKEKIQSKLFYCFSLISAILIAIFSEELSWNWILFFADLILLLLVYSGIQFYNERIKLAENRRDIIKGLNKLGIYV